MPLTTINGGRSHEVETERKWEGFERGEGRRNDILYSQKIKRNNLLKDAPLSK